jgi:hypothetical protein
MPRASAARSGSGGFLTKKATLEAMNELLGRLNRGTFSDPGKRRLSEYLEEWIEGLAALTGESGVAAATGICPVVAN